MIEKFDCLDIKHQIDNVLETGLHSGTQVPKKAQHSSWLVLSYSYELRILDHRIADRELIWIR